MKVKLRFLGFLAKLYGCEETIVEISENSTLRSLLDKISKRKAKFRNTVLDGVELSGTVLVLVNQKEIGVLNGLNTELKDGDEVVFVPVSHGG